MDKPISLSIKDYLIRKMAVKLMVSEKTIESVVNHQFQSTNEALPNNKSVEISGFGKLYFNEGKANKKMEKMLSQKAVFTRIMNDESISEQRRNNAKLKLEYTLALIEALKPKVDNEYRSDLRGVEEQADSPQSPEGDYRADIPAED